MQQGQVILLQAAVEAADEVGKNMSCKQAMGIEKRSPRKIRSPLMHSTFYAIYDLTLYAIIRRETHSAQRRPLWSSSWSLGVDIDLAFLLVARGSFAFGASSLVRFGREVL